MATDVDENAPNWRNVEFFFRDGATQYIELGCKDPYQRWSFPFLFLDTSDLEQALQAADLPAEIARLEKPQSFQVSDEQLDVLAYWLQGGIRFVAH